MSATRTEENHAMDAGTPPRTVIAAGTEIQGTIRGQAGVVVEGKLVGDVHAPSLSIATGASVHGRIEVERLESAGQIIGEIRARHARLSGSLGDGTSLHTAVLEVPLPDDDAAGAGLVLGHCTLRVGADSRRDG
ncbi:MAG: polymer-forming cytoskeletal protein [bacterium]